MNNPYQVLGIVLARAGSQGVPGKHLREILGRPVIEYTLDAAVSSRRVTRLVVSSDCERVMDAARRRFVQTVRRPDALATNNASVQDALLHATLIIESRGFRPDAVVCFYGNVPVRPIGGIDRAIDMLIDTGCDSVRSFVPVGKFHPGWMSKLDAQGVVEPLRPGSIDRRQNLEPLFVHDGSVLVMRRDALQRGIETPTDPHAMFGDDRRGFTIADTDSIEVDREVDLAVAEALLRQRGYHDRSARLAA